jgi:hypothetical protein
MKLLDLELSISSLPTTKKLYRKMFSVQRATSAPGTLNLLSPRSLQEELAGRIADANNYHNSVLLGIFQQAMGRLEQNGCAFSPAVQERVWDRIRPIPLSALRSVLVQEIRAKLFTGLPEDELRMMLDEHKRMEQVLQTHQVFFANVQHMTEAICRRVEAEAQQMIPRFMRTLADALHEELTNVLSPVQDVPS